MSIPFNVNPEAYFQKLKRYKSNTHHLPQECQFTPNFPMDLAIYYVATKHQVIYVERLYIYMMHHSTPSYQNVFCL